MEVRHIRAFVLTPSGEGALDHGDVLFFLGHGLVHDGTRIHRFSDGIGLCVGSHGCSYMYSLIQKCNEE